jgi:hypothetical protein
MAPCHLLCQLLGQCLCDLHAMAWTGIFEENDGGTSQLTCFLNGLNGLKEFRSD